MNMLTKSNYLNGLQCSRLLWVVKHDKERIPEPSDVDKQKFSDGAMVGELAKKLYPNGIDLDPNKNNLGFKENINETSKTLKIFEKTKERHPLFEPGFLVPFTRREDSESNQMFSRGDILVPVLGINNEKYWDIIEVKMGTRVKDVNIDDVAFQKYLYEKAGLRIRNCYLMHVNNQYIQNKEKGSINPKEFFYKQDISEEVGEAIEGIESRIEKMFRIISSVKEPENDIHIYCSNPYECPLKEECWSNLPDENIFQIQRIQKKKAFELYDKGVEKIKDIPEDFRLNGKQRVQKYLSENGEESWKNKEKIKEFLKELNYPLYYLDFETINPVFPKFKGMKPYQRIPFQFSLHIQDSKNQKQENLKHISFLAKGKDDPRKDFLQSLKDNLGQEGEHGSNGDIVVYNKSFEKGVLREAVEAYPEFKDWYYNNIEPRIKDLWDVFRNFHFYHRKQKGSASIKYVLPVLSDLSYKGMDINKGDKASYEFERITHRENPTDEERKRIRKELEDYCKLDTLAEYEIVAGLKSEVF